MFQLSKENVPKIFCDSFTKINEIIILAKRSIFCTIKLQDTATKISDGLLQFIYSLYIIYKI